MWIRAQSGLFTAGQRASQTTTNVVTVPGTHSGPDGQPLCGPFAKPTTDRATFLVTGSWRALVAGFAMLVLGSLLVIAAGRRRATRP